MRIHFLYLANVIIFGLVLSVGAVLVSYFTPDMVYVLGRHQEDLDYPGLADLKASFYEGKRDECDILFMGSSLTACAIDLHRLEEALERRGMNDPYALNLSRVGADAEEMYTLFNRLFPAPETPQWVFIELTRQPLPSRRRTLLPYDPPTYKAKAREILASDEPVLKKLDLLRRLGRKLFLDYQIVYGWWGPRYLWMNYTDGRSKLNESVQQNPMEWSAPPKTPPVTEQKIVREQIQIARETGMNLVYLITPGSDRTLDPRNFMPEEYRRGDFFVFDFNQPDKYPHLFKSEYFLDSVHLNRAGAAVFSETLAEELSELVYSSSEIPG